MSDQLDETGISPDFKAIPLQKLAHVEMGQSPDSRYVYDDPFLGYSFLQGNAEFGSISPEPKFGCTRPAKLAAANDILVSVRAPVGAVNIADRAYCIGRGLAAIRMAGVKPSLAAHLIERQSNKLRRVAQGTTFEAINKNDLLNLELRMPPADELPTIAEILDTLDTAIHETEAIIAKLKAVKQGLLHDLLTRGIAANGELRPPQTEAPHLYKQSPLGWIPEEWDYLALKKRLKKITYGFTNPMPTTDEGPWLLTAADVNDGEIQYAFARHTSPRAFQLLSGKSRPAVGDVLVTKDGTLGRVAVVERDDVCVNQSVAVLSLKNTEDSNYLSTFLQSPIGQLRMLADAGGSTIKHLYITKLAEMEMPWPSEAESARLVQHLSAIADRINFEQLELEKLAAAKSGLMDDLLTGRVRVTPQMSAT